MCPGGRGTLASVKSDVWRWGTTRHSRPAYGVSAVAYILLSFAGCDSGKPQSPQLSSSAPAGALPTHASAALPATSGADAAVPVMADAERQFPADDTCMDVEPSLLSVLVFSATAGFRHASIGAGVAAIESLAVERGWTLRHSEEASVFSDGGLACYDVVVFLSTTGDVLDASQQAAFERFIAAGNGYVGIHAASDTEYEWPWYGELVGAYFRAHPEVQPATIQVEDQTHPATVHLQDSWTRRDEWYAFDRNPRHTVSVLLSLDEASYSPGAGAMEGDHPIAWYHEYGGGRAFYTALGHTTESYSERDFLLHIAGGIEWAADADDP